MKKFKWSALGVRQRTMLSFFLVALIPICCVLVFFYHFNVEELRSDVEQINISRVNQIKSGFEAEIMSHFRLGQVLSNDTTFLPRLRRGNAGDLFEALASFREYLNYRSTESDASVYIASRDQVLHRTGFSSGDAFFQNILGVDTETADFVRASAINIPETSSTSVIPVVKGNGEQALLFLYPLPAYSKSDIVLMVTLSLQEVNGFFEPLLGPQEGAAFLLNSYGRVIFSFNDFEGMVERVEQTALDPARNVIQTQVGGEDYSLVYSVSEKTGLTYGAMIAEDTYHMRVIQQVTLVWQLAVVALILCLVAILFLTMANYRPVKNLLEMSGSNADGSADEYEQIRSNILDTQKRVERLTEDMEAQRPYVLERLLEYMLSPHIGRGQAKQLFEAMNLRFDHDAFFAMSVRALLDGQEASENSAFKAAVIEAAETLADSISRCYCIERMDDNKLAIIVNCEPDMDRHGYVSRFREAVLELNRAMFVVGVGSLTTGYEEIKNSLYEANVLAENVSNRAVSFSEDIETLPGNFSQLYPVRDMMLLIQQLRQGDEQNARESFGHLVESIRRYSGSVLIFRHVSSYIVGALAETARQINREAFQERTQSLLSAMEIEDFRREGERLIEEICAFIAEDKPRASSRLQHEMIDYIDQNCTRPELSLESIAEAFGLSPYYVSRFFREQNHINLKDYIANLRIERAKELLTQTDTPVGDVVSEVGYQSASSFIRKFKAVTGMTPGQYREAHQQGSPHGFPPNQA